MKDLREQIAVVLFTDDIIHGHLQYWEAPTADWSKASVNLKEAYYRLADEILALFHTEHDIDGILNPEKFNAL